MDDNLDLDCTDEPYDIYNLSASQQNSNTTTDRVMTPSVQAISNQNDNTNSGSRMSSLLAYKRPAYNQDAGQNSGGGGVPTPMGTPVANASSQPAKPSADLASEENLQAFLNRVVDDIGTSSSPVPAANNVPQMAPAAATTKPVSVVVKKVDVKHEVKPSIDISSDEEDSKKDMKDIKAKVTVGHQQNVFAAVRAPSNVTVIRQPAPRGAGPQQGMMMRNMRPMVTRGRMIQPSRFRPPNPMSMGPRRPPPPQQFRGGAMVQRHPRPMQPMGQRSGRSASVTVTRIDKATLQTRNQSRDGGGVRARNNRDDSSSSSRSRSQEFSGGGGSGGGRSPRNSRRSESRPPPPPPQRESRSGNQARNRAESRYDSSSERSSRNKNNKQQDRSRRGNNNRFNQPPPPPPKPNTRSADVITLNDSSDSEFNTSSDDDDVMSMYRQQIRDMHGGRRQMMGDNMGNMPNAGFNMQSRFQQQQQQPMQGGVMPSHTFGATPNARTFGMPMPPAPPPPQMQPTQPANDPLLQAAGLNVSSLNLPPPLPQQPITQAQPVPQPGQMQHSVMQQPQQPHQQQPHQLHQQQPHQPTQDGGMFGNIAVISPYQQQQLDPTLQQQQQQPQQQQQLMNAIFCAKCMNCIQTPKGDRFNCSCTTAAPSSAAADVFAAGTGGVITQPAMTLAQQQPQQQQQQHQPLFFSNFASPIQGQPAQQFALSNPALSTQLAHTVIPGQQLTVAPQAAAAGTSAAGATGATAADANKQPGFVTPDGMLTSVGTYKCTLCDKYFFTKAAMVTHSTKSAEHRANLRKKKGEDALPKTALKKGKGGKFSCELCVKSFNSRSALAAHFRWPSHKAKVKAKQKKELRFTCQHCGEKFTSHENKWLHEQSAHSEMYMSVAGAGVSKRSAPSRAAGTQSPMSHASSSNADVSAAGALSESVDDITEAEVPSARSTGSKVDATAAAASTGGSTKSKKNRYACDSCGQMFSSLKGRMVHKKSWCPVEKEHSAGDAASKDEEENEDAEDDYNDDDNAGSDSDIEFIESIPPPVDTAAKKAKPMCQFCERTFAGRLKALSHEKQCKNNPALKCKKCDMFIRSTAKLQSHEEKCKVKRKPTTAAAAARKKVAEKVAEKIKPKLEPGLPAVKAKPEEAAKVKPEEAAASAKSKKPPKPRCKTCGKYFSSVHSLERHEKLHKRRPVTRSVAGEKTVKKSAGSSVTSAPAAATVQGAALKCPKCSYTFTNGNSYTRHVASCKLKLFDDDYIYDSPPREDPIPTRKSGQSSAANTPSSTPVARSKRSKGAPKSSTGQSSALSPQAKDIKPDLTMLRVNIKKEDVVTPMMMSQKYGQHGPAATATGMNKRSESYMSNVVVIVPKLEDMDIVKKEPGLRIEATLISDDDDDDTAPASKAATPKSAPAKKTATSQAEHGKLKRPLKIALKDSSAKKAPAAVASKKAKLDTLAKKSVTTRPRRPSINVKQESIEIVEKDVESTPAAQKPTTEQQKAAATPTAGKGKKKATARKSTSGGGGGGGGGSSKSISSSGAAANKTPQSTPQKRPASAAATPKTPSDKRIKSEPIELDLDVSVELTRIDPVLEEQRRKRQAQNEASASASTSLSASSVQPNPIGIIVPNIAAQLSAGSPGAAAGDVAAKSTASEQPSSGAADADAVSAAEAGAVGLLIGHVYSGIMGKDDGGSKTSVDGKDKTPTSTVIDADDDVTVTSSVASTNASSENVVETVLDSGDETDANKTNASTSLDAAKSPRPADVSGTESTASSHSKKKKRKRSRRETSDEVLSVLNEIIDGVETKMNISDTGSPSKKKSKAVDDDVQVVDVDVKTELIDVDASENEVDEGKHPATTTNAAAPQRVDDVIEVASQPADTAASKTAATVVDKDVTVVALSQEEEDALLKDDAVNVESGSSAVVATTATNKAAGGNKAEKIVNIDDDAEAGGDKPQKVVNIDDDADDVVKVEGDDDVDADDVTEDDFSVVQVKECEASTVDITGEDDEKENPTRGERDVTVEDDEETNTADGERDVTVEDNEEANAADGERDVTVEDNEEANTADGERDVTVEDKEKADLNECEGNKQKKNTDDDDDNIGDGVGEATNHTDGDHAIEPDTDVVIKKEVLEEDDVGVDALSDAEEEDVGDYYVTEAVPSPTKTPQKPSPTTSCDSLDDDAEANGGCGLAQKPSEATDSGDRIEGTTKDEDSTKNDVRMPLSMKDTSETSVGEKSASVMADSQTPAPSQVDSETSACVVDGMEASSPAKGSVEASACVVDGMEASSPATGSVEASACVVDGMEASSPAKGSVEASALLKGNLEQSEPHAHCAESEGVTSAHKETEPMKTTDDESERVKSTDQELESVQKTIDEPEPVESADDEPERVESADDGLKQEQDGNEAPQPIAVDVKSASEAGENSASAVVKDDGATAACREVSASAASRDTMPTPEDGTSAPLASEEQTLASTHEDIPASHDPHEDTPASPDPDDETSASPAPDEETPASATPDKETPASPAPDEETPASPAIDDETPASPALDEETPASPAPDKETTASPTPDEETPASPVPDKETPASPAPDEQTPASPASDEKTPASPAPDEETPASPAPDKETPASPVSDRESFSSPPLGDGAPVPANEAPASSAADADSSASPSPADDVPVASTDEPGVSLVSYDDVSDDDGSDNDVISGKSRLAVDASDVKSTAADLDAAKNNTDQAKLIAFNLNPVSVLAASVTADNNCETETVGFSESISSQATTNGDVPIVEQSCKHVQGIAHNDTAIEATDQVQQVDITDVMTSSGSVGIINEPMDTTD